MPPTTPETSSDLEEPAAGDEDELPLVPSPTPVEGETTDTASDPVTRPLRADTAEQRSSPPPRASAWHRLRSWLGAKWFGTRVRHAWWIDRAWPCLKPHSPKEQHAYQAADERREMEALTQLDNGLNAGDAKSTTGAADRDTLERAEAAAESAKLLLEAERDKRKSIEARLTTILGFVALASTIAISVLGLRLNDRLNSNHPIVSSASILLMAYMVLQLVRAGIAAVTGLGRTGYLEPTAGSFLHTMEPLPRLRHLAKAYLRCAFDHERINRLKVNQLALAHEATKNFLGGLAVLIVVALLGGLLQIWGQRTERGAGALSEHGLVSAQTDGEVSTRHSALDMPTDAREELPRSPATNAGPRADGAPPSVPVAAAPEPDARPVSPTVDAGTTANMP